MTLPPKDLQAAVDVARDYRDCQRLARVAGGALCADHAALAYDFAEALVKITDCCAIGVPCERHSGAVHGKEAEELRAGVEQILHNTVRVRDDEASFVLTELRKSLIFLLDRVDARDSLAFRETSDLKEDA